MQNKNSADSVDYFGASTEREEVSNEVDDEYGDEDQ